MNTGILPLSRRINLGTYISKNDEVAEVAYCWMLQHIGMHSKVSNIKNIWYCQLYVFETIEAWTTEAATA